VEETGIKYRLIHGHFHIGLVIIPRPPYWSERESRDDNQVNMEKKTIVGYLAGVILKVC
jgi:hypothetical protein